MVTGEDMAEEDTEAADMVEDTEAAVMAEVMVADTMVNNCAVIEWRHIIFIQI
uniref:Uncharacterized protein n=1 Tax=Arion vulgaris TaxID=1028688 RepID=A0A0B6Z6F2_9EUPU